MGTISYQVLPRFSELFQAFDLQILWNKTGQQATVFAQITDATLQALPAILDPAGTGTMTLPMSSRRLRIRGAFVRGPR